MGAYAPVPHLQKYYDAAIKEVLDVSLGALSKEGQTYRGFIFCGLMISPEGNINVLEYNVRLGDPETCVLLPLASDVGLDIRDILIKAASGKLKEKILVKPKSFALGTVLASKGYPDAPKPVFGFTLVSDKNAWWCHAGTMLMENKTYQHKGGRVACAVSLADSLKTAQAQSLALVKQNVTTDMIYRSDIGYRAIDSMKK
jgi:phosphoribosylamine--glycine ligase